MLAKNLSDLLNRLGESGPPRFRTVFLGSFLIVACKNGFDGVLYPLLYSEDAGNIFKHFYNRHEFREIFVIYAYYLRIVPNLIGYMAGYLPIQASLSFYCLVSLGMTALAYSLFYRVLNHLFNDPRFSVCCVLIISALPLGNFQIVEALMYQIWHCTLMLLLLTLLPIPNNPWRRTGFILAAHLFIWSHPYSIMALPLFAWNFLRRKEHRWAQAGFALSAILYYLIAVERQPLHLSSLEYFIPTLMSRVVTETLIGSMNRVHLQFLGGINAFAFMVIIPVIGILVSAWKKWDLKQKWFLAVCLYLILVPLAASLVSRDLGAYYHLLRGSPRYVYLPKLFFTVIVLLAARELFKRFAPFRKWSWALVILLLSVNLNSNVLYNTNANLDRENLRFMAQLQRGTVACESGEEKIIYLDRGQWVLPVNRCRY